MALEAQLPVAWLGQLAEPALCCSEPLPRLGGSGRPGRLPGYLSSTGQQSLDTWLPGTLPEAQGGRGGCGEILLGPEGCPWAEGLAARVTTPLAKQGLRISAPLCGRGDHSVGMI